MEFPSENSVPETVTNIMSGTSSTSASDSLIIQSQVDFSRLYISTAAMHARECARIEKGYVTNSLSEFSMEFEELHDEYKAHAISSVIYAVSFLEATANKFLVNAVEMNNNISHPHYTVSQAIVREVKTSNFQAKRAGGPDVLKKFDTLLFYTKNKGSGTRNAVYEEVNHFTSFDDTALLINLRNAYIHYAPRLSTLLFEDKVIIEFDDKEIDKLRVLNKFSLNQLLTVGSMRPFFPEVCLGHGCSKWSVNTSIQFAEEFYQKIGEPFPLKRIQVRLKTEA